MKSWLLSAHNVGTGPISYKNWWATSWSFIDFAPSTQVTRLHKHIWKYFHLHNQLSNMLANYLRRIKTMSYKHFNLGKKYSGKKYYSPGSKAGCFASTEQFSERPPLSFSQSACNISIVLFPVFSLCCCSKLNSTGNWSISYYNNACQEFFTVHDKM